WRDWVIQAFLENKPYDAFLVEQLAGDLLPNATDDQRAATGFLRNGMNTHEGGTIAEEYRVAYTVDKVDTVGTSILGLTLKCAQCHDHKYDPVSQKEFFQFFAFFNSSDEPGKGATNANTQPVMPYDPPFGAPEAQWASRLKELGDLLIHPDPRLVRQRAQWLESLPPPTVTANDNAPGFP
ncbi:MAG: DUF1549 domain-containing protein, partial [Verrucomicrobiae bacterium]|nr:DUF1549 domain-containing protein [Verrucomicrobiae bacterium]